MPVAQRRGRALTGDGNLLFRRRVAHLDPAHFPHHLAVRRGRKVRADFQQLTLRLRERIRTARAQRERPGALRFRTQRCEFLHRLPREPRPVRRAAQREFARKLLELIERHPRRVALPPADLHAASVRQVAEGLRRVESAPAMPRQLARFRREFFAVKRADQVFAARRREHPFFLRRIAIHRQLEKIRALEKPRRHAAQRPLAQIRRREKMDRVIRFRPARRGGQFDVEREHPLLRRLVPENLRVAVAAADFFDHRIAREFRERATVVAVGQALHGRVARGGVN